MLSLFLQVCRSSSLLLVGCAAFVAYVACPALSMQRLMLSGLLTLTRLYDVVVVFQGTITLPTAPRDCIAPEALTRLAASDSAAAVVLVVGVVCSGLLHCFVVVVVAFGIGLS